MLIVEYIGESDITGQHDTIGHLLGMLDTRTLCPSWESSGNFITPFKPAEGWNEGNVHLKGSVSFLGGFYDKDYPFNIITNDETWIILLTARIRSNQASADYLRIKFELLAKKELAKYEKRLQYALKTSNENKLNVYT